MDGATMEPYSGPIAGRDFYTLPGDAHVRWTEVNGEGKSGERLPAFVDFALRGRQLSRQQALRSLGTGREEVALLNERN